MGKERKGKFVERFYFCTKRRKMIWLKWDYSENRVDNWWWTDFTTVKTFKGNLKDKTPKSWVEIGWMPEGSFSEIYWGKK